MNNNCDDSLFEIPDDAERVVKAPAGRSKVFRRYDPGQSLLMPASLDDWLPQDHTARFIAETVGLLDLSVVYDSYVVAPGAPSYDPTIMLKLLFYAYSTAVTSSREMEQKCHVDVAFRWLTANSAPDYRSISRFRRRHLTALGDLFTQVLVLWSETELVKLGRVALDGTKLRSPASRHKAMSYSPLGPRIEQLQAEVAALLAEAEATDLAEDEEYGEGKRGDEVPPELARRETRIAKMRAAKEAIEAKRQRGSTRDPIIHVRGARLCPDLRNYVFDIVARMYFDERATVSLTSSPFSSITLDLRSKGFLAAEVLNGSTLLDSLVLQCDVRLGQVDIEVLWS